MKTFNFDQLKSVKTPESWIENALEISKNKKKPIYLRPHIIASAACFIVCCALSFVIFANFGANDITPIYPAVKNTSSAINNPTHNPNPSTNPDDTAPIMITIPQSDGTTVIINQGNNTIDASFPVLFPTIAPTVSQSTATETISDNSTNPSTTVPKTEVPTTGVSDSTFPEITVPVVTEPQETTAPIIVEPTAPVEPSEPNIDSDLPQFWTTAPATAVPTTVESNTGEGVVPPMYDYFKSFIFFYADDDSIFSIKNRLTCKIESTYDSAMFEIGTMKTEKTENSFYAMYAPSSIRKGNYRVTIFDDYGNSVTYQAYLGSKTVRLYE